MIKETNEEQNKEVPCVQKTEKLEPKELSSNSKDINNMYTGISNINLSSEQTQLTNKEVPVVNKESNNKNKLELENNQNIEIKNNEKVEKEKLSSLDDKIINNKKTNIPFKYQSSPLNFRLKKNANFQMKLRKNTYTESDYNSGYYNSVNIKSPICSYYDQSQKYLSANYNGDNYLTYSEKKTNNKKSIEHEDNQKNIINEENSDNRGLNQIKTDKSLEHDNESMNYNDLNLFMSPDIHNSSQVSAGQNNFQTNKLSRKSSQATHSYNGANSQNKIANSGLTGENENIDFNLEIPLNESNDEQYNVINLNNNANNIYNEDIKPY